MPAGAHRAHQHIHPAELIKQLQRQRPVAGDVVGVAVLVGAPGPRLGGQQLGDPVFTGLLPAPHRVRLGDQLDIGAVGGQHVTHDRLHAGVGDHGDRMPIGLAGQRQPQPQAAAGGFHDARPGS